MTYEEAEKVASKIKTIYESRFGGKDKGRFLLSRSQLRQLAGMKRLEDTTKDLIVEAAYEAGYVVTDLGDDFAVIDEDVMHRFRKVPERLLK